MRVVDIAMGRGAEKPAVARPDQVALAYEAGDPLVEGWVAFGGMSSQAPEKRLMVGMLRQALLDVRGDDGRYYGRRQRGSARRWLMSRSMANPLTFESICEVLGIDAERIRAWVVSGAAAPRPKFNTLTYRRSHPLRIAPRGRKRA